MQSQPRTNYFLSETQGRIYKDFTSFIQIIITHRIGWRRTFSSATFCDESTIASGRLIGQGGTLQCRTGCSGGLGSMQFQCTDFSETEDWSSGQRTYTYDISGVDYFEAS